MKAIDYYLQEAYLEETLTVEEFSALKGLLSKILQRKNNLKIAFKKQRELLLKKHSSGQQLQKLKELFDKEINELDLKIRDFYYNHGEQIAKFVPGQ